MNNLNGWIELYIDEQAFCVNEVTCIECGTLVDLCFTDDEQLALCEECTNELIESIDNCNKSE